MTEPEIPVRDLPEASRSSCQGCGSTVVWATTIAGPGGRGGKLMPLDPVESLEGNVAATNPRRGYLVARVLQRDEYVDRPLEYAAMPHFATCFTRTKPEIPAEVIQLQEERQKRRTRRGGRR